MVNDKRRVFFLDLLLICVILLTGCQPSQATSSPTQAPTQSPTSIPLPEPDKATVIGQIVSQEDRSPIRDTVVHLAAVYRQGEEGAYVIDSANSPGAFTDQEGRFVIENITPGEFVLVIGDPMTNYAVVSDEEGKVKTWAAASNQILDMDQIRTDFIP
jgi:hypothetical protein